MEGGWEGESSGTECAVFVSHTPGSSPGVCMLAFVIVIFLSAAFTDV